MLSTYPATVHEEDDEADEKGNDENDEPEAGSAGMDLKEVKPGTVLLVIVCREGHSWSLGMLTLQWATLTLAHVENP
jgi:hypothetical protein